MSDEEDSARTSDSEEPITPDATFTNNSNSDSIADRGNRLRAEQFKDKGNNFLLKSLDYESAIDCYSSAIALVDSNYIYYNNRAAAYTGVQNFSRAIDDCDHSLLLKADNVRAYSRKAAALCELGLVFKAIVTVSKGLEFSPEDAPSLAILAGLEDMRARAEAFNKDGNAHLQGHVHNWVKAVEAYTSAIEIVPTHYIYFNNRAAAYVFAGEYEKAVGDSDTSLGLEGCNVRAFSRKATALGGLSRIGEAYSAVRSGLLLAPTDKQCLAVVSTLDEMTAEAEKNSEEGLLLMQSNPPDPVKAETEFSRALAIDTSNYVYYNHRAIAYAACGDLEKAIADCHSSLCLVSNVRAYECKALCLLKMGKVDDALVTIESGLEVDPRDEGCLAVEARVLREKVTAEDVNDQVEERRSPAAAAAEEEEEMGKTGHRFLQGVKHLGDKVKSKISIPKTVAVAAQEDSDVLTAQRHARRVRCKLRCLREEKTYIHLVMHEDDVVKRSLEIARHKRKDRILKCLYEKRVRLEDDAVRVQYVRTRLTRREKYITRLKVEDMSLVTSQHHSRDLRQYRRMMERIAEKKKLDQEERNAKRNSSKWIKDAITKKKTEKLLRDPPVAVVPEHLMPFDDKVDMWRQRICKQLRRHWSDMSFSVEYVQEEGIRIGFNVEDEEEIVKNSVDFKISRYMNQLAIQGVLHELKLHKRADMWRKWEDSYEERGMCLCFYCHIPRTIETHLKMPRTVATDIIDRENNVYDYDLVPRPTIMKELGQSAYTRDNRPPMIKATRMRSRGGIGDERRKKKVVPDVKELVELPSVVVDTLSPGFVRMTSSAEVITSGFSGAQAQRTRISRGGKVSSSKNKRGRGT